MPREGGWEQRGRGEVEERQRKGEELDEAIFQAGVKLSSCQEIMAPPSGCVNGILGVVPHYDYMGVVRNGCVSVGVGWGCVSLDGLGIGGVINVECV